jgi:hypothetical protein
MTDFEPLAGLSVEETQQLLLITLMEIRERLPRLDTLDRAAVSLEASSATVAATISSGTVTTASDVTRLNNFGTSGATSRPADAMPLHAANAGAEHIYRQIVVS